MTRDDLVASVVRAAGLAPKEAERCVVAILETIAGTLRAGKRVEIRGFGTFGVRQRGPRTGRNPKTGARVDVPAKRVAFFKPGLDLRKLVNRTSPLEEPGANSAA